MKADAETGRHGDAVIRPVPEIITLSPGLPSPRPLSSFILYLNSIAPDFCIERGYLCPEQTGRSPLASTCFVEGNTNECSFEAVNFLLQVER